MIMKREMFFDWDTLKKRAVVQMIVSNPTEWEAILDFIWDEMRKDEEFNYEMKRLETKYHHDVKELKERFWVLDE